MATSSIKPIVVIDEEEVIVIGDESEDEIEILEHGESWISNVDACRPSRRFGVSETLPMGRFSSYLENSFQVADDPTLLKESGDLRRQCLFSFNLDVHSAKSTHRFPKRPSNAIEQQSSSRSANHPNANSAIDRSDLRILERDCGFATT